MTGITEYAIADIYEYVQKPTERDFVLKFSAMEIYNESVRDLLGEDKTPLRLLDDPERGTVIEKLTEETLRDWNYVIHLLSICEAQRQIGETSLNETSSRSHQIIRLTIESSSGEHLGRDNNSSTRSATVNFVDLAGSERTSQSLSAGTRLKEGCHINRSLLTLGTVIRKLRLFNFRAVLIEFNMIIKPVLTLLALDSDGRLESCSRSGTGTGTGIGTGSRGGLAILGVVRVLRSRSLRELFVGCAGEERSELTRFLWNFGRARARQV
ncbi:kinesin-like protein KIN-7F [Solanum dulcamara]|uniref:kinesin-like protein KIN-7F n=1 Tax=Solanum dulcamara TaxID=45834 RepID=UPI002485D042|nr:kinesin-like protein KIN-7F [Solanum dulcamara]